MYCYRLGFSGQGAPAKGSASVLDLSAPKADAFSCWPAGKPPARTLRRPHRRIFARPLQTATEAQNEYTVALQSWQAT